MKNKLKKLISWHLINAHFKISIIAKDDKKNKTRNFSSSLVERFFLGHRKKISVDK